MKIEEKTCPVCRGPMHFIYGNGFDYDAYFCDGLSCLGEIVLETSTYPEDQENDQI